MTQPADQKLESAGVIVPWTGPGDRPSSERLVETEGLVIALGCDAAFVEARQLRQPSASHLLSGGQLDDFSDALEANECSLAVIDASLTPVQQRNLETALGLKVIDRTGLILEIFGLRARTREGVLQVEYARLLYERSRLVRTWTHLERQRGGGGFLGGPGETQLESDRRMLDRQLGRLKRDLDSVKRTRRVQREGRQRRDRPLIALVGYTNVGKSTLFNRLSGADVLVRDMPFATLDSTIRRFALNTLGEADLVDTVGFISDLPTHLIESFRATLEETLDADLILHIRDRSNPDEALQKSQVLKVLDDLSETAGVDLPPIVEVWNKADQLDNMTQMTLRAQIADGPEPPAVLLSAHNGEGMERLKAMIEAFILREASPVTITLGPEHGAARAFIYERYRVDNERLRQDGGMDLDIWISVADRGRLISRFGDLFA